LAGEHDEEPSHNIKILIVDDQPDILLTFKAVLEQHGYYVKTFDKPARALEHLKDPSSPIHYDLIITDYRMPGGISGLDLAKAIKDHDVTKNKRTKILLVTAYENGSSYNGFSEALASGLINEIIPKPVQNSKLIAVIEKIFLHNNHH
jgi:CheY-like chemotaxis protein